MKIIVRVLYTVFHPIMRLLFAVGFQRQEAFNKDIKPAGVNPLYFGSNIPGFGVMKCNRCSFRQEIVGFLHGFGNDPWSKTGVQCQRCGKFHSVDKNKNPIKNKCECGGRLEREKALFCPSCKSKDISYRIKYMT